MLLYIESLGVNRNILYLVRQVAWIRFYSHTTFVAVDAFFPYFSRSWPLF